MKKIFIILLSAAAAAGCSSNRFTIEGSGEPFANMSYVTLKAQNELGYTTIDSVAVIDSGFEFKGTTEQPHLAYIAMVTPDLDEVDGIKTATIPVFIEPGEATVSKRDDMFEVTGTPMNDKLAAFNNRLNEVMIESSDLVREGRQAEIEALQEKFLVEVKRSVDDNAANPFGAWLLRYMHRSFSPQEVIDGIAKLPEEVQPEFDRIREQAEAKLRTEPGQPYIDIAQKDADGKEVTLGSVIQTEGNKYVLVDFWASWCSPCMGEVPFLVETYTKYHGKGFEIYGVSFDSDRTAWTNAVKDNAMTWIQVSDVKGWDNQARHDYVVNSIPANYLVDCSTGKIVATNLRGEKLPQKIAGLLD